MEPQVMTAFFQILSDLLFTTTLFFNATQPKIRRRHKKNYTTGKDIDVIMGQFYTSRYFPEGTDENHERRQSE
jgi:hypothetical protein